MMRLGLLGLLFYMLLACSEPAVLKSTNQYQFSDALVLDGQLSGSGDQVMLLIEGPNLVIWRVYDNQTVISLNEAQLPKNVRVTHLNERANLLLVAGDNVVQFWHSLTGALIGSLQAKGVDELARVSALSTSDDGDEVAIGFTDGSVSLFKRKSKEMKQFMPHSSNIIAMHFVKGNRMVTGAHDGLVKAWDKQTGDNYYQRKYNTRLSSLTISADHQQLFVADALKTQEVLSVSNGETLSELNYITRFKWFRHALFIPRSTYLVTSTPKAELSIWDTSSGKERLSWQIEVHSMGTTLLDMVIINDQLITLSSEGVIETWPLMSALTDL
ncbi:WD40 repeat domain-containing protein [Pseudoalteromonas sp. JBTF-M23]|uniref:WD40 repeat domain-containing protein n=1 Tax=Pseudoalteromonas caenipelagi TaxID=2726988 RepID=A0A849VBA8_9GAMM|nr:WD40 repeat domain-containing protein [Pseudoalteromonas caenipelagi]NOU50060.1 WD40 repeat domain-containing protein [Pseudoalteromonas caenipelagi]